MNIQGYSELREPINQNARKLLSTDLVNTKVGYESIPSENTPARNDILKLHHDSGSLICTDVKNIDYRIYSINRPGRLLNFWTLRVGAYSRLGAY